MGTRRFAACATTIGSLILFALSSGTTALAATTAPGGGDMAAATVVCEPAGTVEITRDDAGTPTTISCIITQPGLTPGNNEARCIEQSSAPAIDEICVIEQTNTSGDNHAVVLQQIRQKDGPTQTGSQRATIMQNNSTGSNDASANQDLSQSSDAAGDQTQTSDQGHRPLFGGPTLDPGVKIQQTNGTGSNKLHLNQSAKQKQKTGDDGALQSQTGLQSSQLDQEPGGDTHASIKQDIDQKQDGPNPDNQAQLADPHCCNFFVGTKVDVDLNQDVTQRAMMGATQFGENTAHCVATAITGGNCNVRETINQNGPKLTTTCSAPTCAIGQSCLNGTCAPCSPLPTEGGLSTCPPPPCLANCGRASAGVGLSGGRLALVAALIRSSHPVRLSTA